MGVVSSSLDTRVRMEYLQEERTLSYLQSSLSQNFSSSLLTQYILACNWITISDPVFMEEGGQSQQGNIMETGD